jgi:rhodanese-related sulfurtransferase
MVAEGAALIDVRGPDEYRAGHLPGAINVPLADLASSIKQLDPSVPVVVYCASGGRSARASAELRAAGYVVHDLGAMSRWR